MAPCVTRSVAEGAVHLSWLHTVADALPKFLCPFCTLPPLLPVVGRGLVYCLRIAVFIPSAYLCPLFISLISLLSTFLEPSALPPHSLQCSEVDTEGKHTLNLQWPGSPCAQCASSSSSAYSKPQLASPAHLMEFLVHFVVCTIPLPTNFTSFPDRRSPGTPSLGHGSDSATSTTAPKRTPCLTTNITSAS